MLILFLVEYSFEMMAIQPAAAWCCNWDW